MIQDNTKLPGSEPLSDMFWDWMREQDADWCDRLETRIEYLETMNRILELDYAHMKSDLAKIIQLVNGVNQSYGVGDE